MLERGPPERGLVKGNVPNFGRSRALSSMSEPFIRRELAHAARVRASQGGFHRRAASREPALCCGLAADHERARRTATAAKRAASRLHRERKHSGEANRRGRHSAQATARGLSQATPAGCAAAKQRRLVAKLQRCRRLRWQRPQTAHAHALLTCGFTARARRARLSQRSHLQPRRSAPHGAAPARPLTEGGGAQPA